ncbi:hypothetical protein DPMN_075894 [Dreissena polymorpha]|uniref:TIR domain-containing protein n=1 Tax=Dreissena polymorpha TaxID=45954 RepID=A0A9D3YL98_DREPO|nr:hypothetical protein DPMN_075894 [Dreissena polymorpha]
MTLCIIFSVKNVSIEDVKYRKKTLYHAFVSYTDEDPRDRDFVKTLIRELEFKRGLGLFVPGRNDLPGPARHTVAAYLIEKRCRRVIIVLSNSYTKSDACNFQMKFTHALSPDARKRKLIPVVRDSCVSIPNILNFISVCDFSKEDDVDWTWTRLFMALYSPIDDTANDQTDFNELENSLKDVPIPLWRPLSVTPIDFEVTRYIDYDSQMTPIDFEVISTANTEQTYFVIRGGKAQRIDAKSAVEAASVCGSKSHFAAKFRICPPRHAEASRDPRHDAEAMRIFKSKSFLND